MKAFALTVLWIVILGAILVELFWMQFGALVTFAAVLISAALVGWWIRVWTGRATEAVAALVAMVKGLNTPPDPVNGSATLETTEDDDGPLTEPEALAVVFDVLERLGDEDARRRVVACAESRFVVAPFLRRQAEEQKAAAAKSETERMLKILEAAPKSALAH